MQPPITRPPDDGTATYRPGHLPADTTRTITSNPQPAHEFDEERRQLLRSRLILVHLLFLGFVGLLTVLTYGVPPDNQAVVTRPDQWAWWPLVPPLLESLVGAVVLWRWRGMSVGWLRVWELICFGVQAANTGYHRFDDMVHLGPDPAKIAFISLASLQGFVTFVLAYGVFIPNTRRRSLAVVAALTAVPLVTALAAVAVNPVLRDGGHFAPAVMQWALIMLFPAAIAVFAASRADALQRRAFEAERRAEQVGQYTLRKKLGEGGMGEVWRAEHRLLKRPCAIKFVRAELAANAATAARFAREVQAVTALTHPNTVRVYDYGRGDDGSFFYVMEYLDGPTLDALVKEAGPLPPGRAVHLLRQVCGALAEAHAAGLIHRDIKPGNVIVTAQGGQHDVAKLLDFGLVHDLTTDADADDRLTRTGTVLGTPAFMCPEQAAGESTTDARGDVYSLGAVAFFALTGRPPFQAKPLAKLLAAHRFEIPPPLTDIRPDCPHDLAAVVARCLAKEPAERFQSAAELYRALAACGCAADWSADQAAEWWRVRATS